MVMQGAIRGRPIVEEDMEINSLCKKYEDNAIEWAQNNLVVHSCLAKCGKLGEFDLSQCEGALELDAQLRASDLAYYSLWKDADGLSLALPADVAIAQDMEDEEDLEAA